MGTYGSQYVRPLGMWRNNELVFDLIYGTSWFIGQELKKLQEAESLPFCPTVAAFFSITVLSTLP